MKKTALAVIIGLSSVVNAGEMGPVCSSTNITVPCAKTGWAFGALALYLNPNYSVGSFTQTISHTLVVNSTLTPPNVYDSTGSADTYNTANNTWGWGFKLDGTYYFHTGNDFDINWYHYRHTSNQTIVPGAFANSVNDNPTNALFYSNVANQIQTQWDAVNLELGQHIDVSEWTKMRVHGGFQFAHLQTRDNNTAISPSTAGLAENLVFNGGNIYDQVNAFSTLKYNGFGPRIGVDLGRAWLNGFAIYANGATALLIGTRSFNMSDLGVLNATGVPSFGSLGSQHITASQASDMVIVPELEVKAGLTYNTTWNLGALNLDAGWMWTNYFNVLATNGTDFEDTTGLGVQGPYVGLKWVSS